MNISIHSTVGRFLISQDHHLASQNLGTVPVLGAPKSCSALWIWFFPQSYAKFVAAMTHPHIRCLLHSMDWFIRMLIYIYIYIFQDKPLMIFIESSLNLHGKIMFFQFPDFPKKKKKQSIEAHHWAHCGMEWSCPVLPPSPNPPALHKGPDDEASWPGGRGLPLAIRNTFREVPPLLLHLFESSVPWNGRNPPWWAMETRGNLCENLREVIWENPSEVIGGSDSWLRFHQSCRSYSFYPNIWKLESTHVWLPSKQWKTSDAVGELLCHDFPLCQWIGWREGWQETSLFAQKFLRREINSGKPSYSIPKSSLIMGLFAIAMWNCRDQKGLPPLRAKLWEHPFWCQMVLDRNETTQIENTWINIFLQ